MSPPRNYEDASRSLKPRLGALLGKDNRTNIFVENRPEKKTHNSFKYLDSLRTHTIIHFGAWRLIYNCVSAR